MYRVGREIKSGRLCVRVLILFTNQNLLLESKKATILNDDFMILWWEDAALCGHSRVSGTAKLVSAPLLHVPLCVCGPPCSPLDTSSFPPCVYSPAHCGSCLPPSVQWAHGPDPLVASWQHAERQKREWSCPAYVLLSGSIPVSSSGPRSNLILVQRPRRRLGYLLQLMAFPGAAGLLLHELGDGLRGVCFDLARVVAAHVWGVPCSVSWEVLVWFAWSYCICRIGKKQIIHLKIIHLDYTLKKYVTVFIFLYISKDTYRSS